MRKQHHGDLSDNAIVENPILDPLWGLVSQTRLGRDRCTAGRVQRLSRQFGPIIALLHLRTNLDRRNSRTNRGVGAVVILQRYNLSTLASYRV